MASTATQLQAIDVPAVPPTPGAHYSRALRVPKDKDLLFLTGLTAFSKQPGSEEENKRMLGDIEAQTRACFQKVEAVVKAAGGTLEDVVQIRIYYKDVTYVPAVVKMRNEFFTREPYPTVTGLVCDLTSPEILIEVDAIAAL